MEWFSSPLLYFLFPRNFLPAMVERVYIGLNDSELAVRNAALFALGQFSEHLQVGYSVGWREQGKYKKNDWCQYFSFSFSLPLSLSLSLSLSLFLSLSLTLSLSLSLFHSHSHSSLHQPEISQFSGKLLPCLFQFLDSVLVSGMATNGTVTRTFYAMETFCEHLGNVFRDPFLCTVFSNVHFFQVQNYCPMFPGSLTNSFQC